MKIKGILDGQKEELEERKKNLEALIKEKDELMEERKVK